MSPEERDILARAPLTLTIVSLNTRRIALARQMAREGLVTVDYVDGRAAGDPSSVRIWLTQAGAEAYAREHRA